MKYLFERFWLFFSYFLLKADEHSLQGPFAFSFYELIIDNKQYQPDPEIESLRKKFSQSGETIKYHSFGKASSLSKNSRSKISRITKNGISSFNKSRLFYNIIQEYQPDSILELGTSLGINTCYLSKATEKGDVYTFEGHPELCEFAKSTFKKLDLTNIHLVEGNIDQTLPNVIEMLDRIDFVIIDANHKSKSLVKYFKLLSSKCWKKSIMVVDDIRWNSDMYSGWIEISQNPRVSHSFDLGSLGILAFEKNIAQQNYILGF